jgi:hypothetical protein
VISVEAGGLRDLAGAWAEAVEHATQRHHAAVVSVCVDHLLPVPDRHRRWRIEAHLGLHHGKGATETVRIEPSTLQLHRRNGTWDLRVRLALPDAPGDAPPRALG